MSDNEKKVVIGVALVAALVLFYFWYSTPAATATTVATLPVSPSSPNPVSLPDPVSVASSVSEQTGEDITPPVALTGTTSSFVAGVTSPETQNAGTPLPVSNLPAGFMTWYNSLGPVNQAWIASQVATMPQADIDFINTMVTQNLWGQSAQASQWNAFCSAYGLPHAGSFSSFSGPTTKKPRRK